MRLPTTRHGALVALGVILHGCASTPSPQSSLGLEPSSATLAHADSFAGTTGIAGAVHNAKIQRQSGDLDGAIRTLSQLALVAPDDPRVLGEYGKTLVARGATGDAIGFLSRAVALDPKEWSLYSALGVAFDHQGDYATAKVAYERALALKPDDPTVLSNAGMSRMQAGDLSGAEALLSQAAASGGEHPRIVSNLTLIRRLREALGADPDLTAETVPAIVEPQFVEPQFVEPEIVEMTIVEPETIEILPKLDLPAVPTPDIISSTPIPPPASATDKDPDTTMASMPDGPALTTDEVDFDGQTVQSPTALEILAADPTVMLAPIPAAPAPETPAATETAIAADSRASSPEMAAGAAPTETLRRLRPTE